MRCFYGWSIEVVNIGVTVAVNLHEIGRKNSLARSPVIYRAIGRLESSVYWLTGKGWLALGKGQRSGLFR